MENTLFDRTFRDSQGQIVIAQMPNLPIIVWLTATLLNLIPTNSNTHTGLDAIAYGTAGSNRLWFSIHLGMVRDIYWCQLLSEIARICRAARRNSV